MEKIKSSSQVAGITSEEARKVIEATKTLSSEQLSELSNEKIALLLYFLVANGTDKTFEDFYDIGNQFGCIAANYFMRTPAIISSKPGACK